MRVSNPRRWCAWGVAGPVLLAGSQLAHALAYRLAYPSVPVRVHVLAASGHGYLAALPLAFGVAGAIALATLGWTALDAARGCPPGPLPPAAFAMLPPLAFGLQELTERWLAVGGVPWWMVEQPTFRIGLLLQLPFGLVAYALTRTLLRGARELGLRAAPLRPPRLRSILPPQAPAPAEPLLAAGPPILHRPTRGPPAIRR